MLTRPNVNPHIFRENDVRGHAERDLDDRTVAALGAALGRRASARRVSSPLVVGRDGRLSSPRLWDALVRGARAYCDVLDLGVVPTPVVSFAAQHLAPAGLAAVPVAVMITGSHNPAEDNGFKISFDGESLHGDQVAGLRAELAAELARGTLAPARHDVRAVALGDAYLDAVVGALRLGPRRFGVALDAGNGVAGPLAVALFERLGFPTSPIFVEIDGRFPHHHPDPTVEANLRDLREATARAGAELGVGFDGDGDRLGVVDERGRVVWGDQLLILFGRAIAAEVPGAHMLAEVKCSQVAFDELAAAGAHLEMWKVGHSRLKARMRQTGALLAGEMSGHFFFAHRWRGFDDALYAAARLLELLSHGPRRLAERVDELPAVVNTPELRVACPDGDKAAVVALVAARLRAHPQVRALVEIDGVRAIFDGGWALVRASTTGPILVTRYEASSQARLAQVRAMVEAQIAEAVAAVGAGPGR